MKSVEALRELGKHTEPCIWTADDVKSAVMIEKETFDKCLDNIEREVADMVSLPVDADGVPIHVGDVMDGYSKTIEVVELRTGRSGWVLISRDGNGYADCAAFSHHHAPTVEDVLREMLKHFGAIEEVTPEVAEYIAEYAAKLTLRGDE